MDKDMEQVFKELAKQAKSPRAHAALKTLHAEFDVPSGPSKGEAPLSPGQRAAQAGGGAKPFGDEPKAQAMSRISQQVGSSSDD